jgi:DNA-binding response OmpR family regulator
MEQSRKILIADDDSSVREILRMMLEEDGYEVLEAVDGQEAWEKLNAQGADMGIFDLNMPRLDGLQLTQRIRQDPRYSELPILMLTVRALVIEQIRGYDRGADEYVTKPFEREVLLARVKALERRLRP